MPQVLEDLEFGCIVIAVPEKFCEYGTMPASLRF